MDKIISWILMTLFCGAVFFACDQREKNVNMQTTITVAAASSLKNVLERELIPLFRQKYPEITVKGIYDSSGRLQTQISFGLPADIFISASPSQMNALLDKSLVLKESVKPLTENKVVLIKTAGIDSPARNFETVTAADIIAIGNPASVPAGEHAREIFRRLGIWEEVLPKASLAANVTEVLFWVGEGISEVGIVYATDALSTDKVEIIDTAPQGISAVYFIGILSSSIHQKEPRLFIDFLSSAESLTVFKRFGFE